MGDRTSLSKFLITSTWQAYDSSVDMWAIGVVTYMLLCGKRPFHHADRKTKMKIIQA